MIKKLTTIISKSCECGSYVIDITDPEKPFCNSCGNHIDKIQLKRLIDEAYDHINPNHYKKGNKEVWEMMVNIWGKEAFIKHCEMCAFKYRMRLGEKPDQPTDRDLNKARWYEAKAKELRAKHK